MNKKLFILFVIFFINTSNIFCQKILPINENWRIKMGFDLRSCFYYGATNDWLGKHNTTGFILAIGYQKIILTSSFQLSITQTKSALNFNNNILPIGAEINDSKLEINGGYEHELLSNFRIEPYLGYVWNPFTVVDSFNKDKFHLNYTKGVSIGCNLNKYINFGKGDNLGILIGYNYSFINYKKVHPSLDPNYSGISFGLNYMWTTEKDKGTEKDKKSKTIYYYN